MFSLNLYATYHRKEIRIWFISCT